MKNTILILTIILAGHNVFAQQDVILTKYTFNSLFFNPAYAGSAGEGQGSLLVNYRDQWMGFDGAPKTFMMSGDVNLASDKLGFGLTTGRERIGIDSRIDVAGSLAYRIHVGQDDVLSGGIRAGYHLFRSEYTDIRYGANGDPIYDRADPSFGVLTLGAGLYYTAETYYAGLSVPAISTISDERENFKVRHYYFHAGALFSGEYSNFSVEPTLLIKYQKAAPMQYTIGMNLWFLDDFALGAFYRSTNTLGLSAEFLFFEQFTVGAAYGFSLADLRNISSGSLEFLIGYRFGAGKNGHTARRRFK